MTELIDLSHRIYNDMPVYPGDIPLHLTQDKFYATDHYNNFVINSGMHVGTHVDTPMHMSENTTSIGDIPLHVFTGKASLLDVRDLKTICFCNNHPQKVNNGDIVLIHTGHSSLFGKKEYYESHPVIDRSFAEFLISKNIRLVGIDTPSPDRFPFEIHKLLFKQNILIIENLCNLDKLLEAKSIEVFAFPLKIKADASLVRVVAKVEY